MEKQFPKILLIGNSINLHWGGGITLYNLLKGWPKDKIAMADRIIEEEGTDICNSYYRLGYEETKRPWPLYRFQPYYKSGEVNFDKNKLDSVDFKVFNNKKSKYNKKLKNIFESILHFFGLYYILFPLRTSKSFINWVNQIKPDIIYTQITIPEYIPFIESTYKKTRIPYVIHMMDDWPLILCKSGLSTITWRPYFQKKFKRLVNNSSGLMSICQAMSDEYLERYNQVFVPFHNCIDLQFWYKGAKESYESEDAFKVLYAGRIGLGTSNSVLTVAEAIENLVQKGVNIEFHLQVSSIPDNIARKMENIQSVKIKPFIPYEQLPDVFRNADLLLLPMDYDKQNLDFIHLSMPTKVPEYMISGTPILVFAHQNTALFKYANSENWAFTESENNISLLAETINKIYDNAVLRKEIAENAIKIAYENHDGKKVRDRFREYLSMRGFK